MVPACTLLLGASMASGSAPDEVDVRWSLRDGDLAIWKSFPIPVGNTEKTPLLTRGPFLGIFGYQVDEEKGASYPIWGVRDIPADLALKVPLGRLKKGWTFQLHVRYDEPWSGIYEARLDGKVVKVADGKCRVRGTLSVDPVKRPRLGGPFAPESFQGTFDTIFDFERGVVETSTVRILPQGERKKRRNPGKGRQLLRGQVQGVRLELKEIRRRGPDLAWRKEIDDSIRRGTVWLMKRQKEDKGMARGTARGANCLVALTLLASEVPRDDPVVESLFEDIRKYNLRETYEISLGLMAMEAYLRQDPEDRGTQARRSGKKDLEWMKEMTRRLLKNSNRDSGGWDWGYGRRMDRADLSNTQYAALGLFAARRAGVKIKAEVWANLALGVLRYQGDGEPVSVHIVREGEGEPDTPTEERKEGGRKTKERKRRPGEGTQERKKVRARGFGYSRSGVPTGSMTVGGIATLQIVLEVLDRERGPRLDPKVAGQVREAINEAWAWMADNWLIQRNPGWSGSWPLYYLYGLERAGVFCRVHSVNGREWYAEGASWLVGTQEEDGNWVGGGFVPVALPGKPPPVTYAQSYWTCWALLFLKQSTRLVTAEPVDPRKTRVRPRRKTPEEEKRPRRR